MTVLKNIKMIFLSLTLWQPFEFYDAKEIKKEIESLAHWIENGEYPKKEDYENV